ncbi:DUF262 domain-containing protein [Caenimonas aquaedulcis]|uniref:DUF262 domain-containing protein n=1 Tax=Caenimonas aquaedulcis TaxID=2793270 RepID=A0A931ME99_9BURK|nr:DUF262 domain-containing protein [Caenimonas aquaedulcis]MBG9386642.1 DUF262 domain-containing protein [Caenimonas aquaedulcis]
MVTPASTDRQELPVLEDVTSEKVGSGVEVERVEDPSATIKEPFDPDQIDVKTKPMVVDLLMSRIRGGQREIDLMPDFQRRAGIWDQTRKSRLVESLLLRIPLPVFYVAADKNERWSVVDGLQRITTLKEFIVDKSLTLKNLEFLGHLNDCDFDGLSREMQRRIQETELTVHIIQPGTPPAVMFNIFKRINTGGLPLSAQEIRHAIKQGHATHLLKELAESPEFKDATRSSIKDERMADRECVLRFCAFWITESSSYPNVDLDTFLIDAMEKINHWSPLQLVELSSIFLRSLKLSKLVLGKWAFRKYYGANYRLSPINKALFEVWTVTFAGVSDEQAVKLVERKEVVLQKFGELMRDRSFEESISIGTGSAANVRKRFIEIKSLILGVLSA